MGLNDPGPKKINIFGLKSLHNEHEKKLLTFSSYGYELLLI